MQSSYEVSGNTIFKSGVCKTSYIMLIVPHSVCILVDKIIFRIKFAVKIPWKLFVPIEVVLFIACVIESYEASIIGKSL